MLCPLIWAIKRGTFERIGLLNCPHLHAHSFHDNPNRQGKKRGLGKSDLGIPHFDTFYIV